MDINLLYIVIGGAIGFCVALPVGPIGIFVIRQSSTYGWIGGLVTGLGASIADAIYTAIAGFGASFLEGWIHQYLSWFELMGGLFLVYVAHQIASTKIALDHAEDPTPGNLWRACWMTMFMTFLSPMTTLLFLAMFSKFGVLNDQLTSMRIYELSVGVCLGAMLWWTILSFIVSKISASGKQFNIKALFKGPLKSLRRVISLLFPELKHQDHLDLISIVNRISAVCIFIFGVLMVSKGTFTLSL